MEMELHRQIWKLAGIRPFTWNGASSEVENVVSLKTIWFLVGFVNLVYQNFGLVMFLLLPQSFHSDEIDEQEQIAKIAETISIMCLTFVCVCYIWTTFWHGKRFSILMEQFQLIFPSTCVQQQQIKYRFNQCGTTAGFYRVQYYYEKSQLLMRVTKLFFMSAMIYYNSLPIVELTYEAFWPNNIVKYRYQSNTWYMWQSIENQKSLVSFVVAYFCQMFSSIIGVSFIMAVKFMLCFFITQMQMHFDFLANALENLDATQQNANERLKFIINYHNRLLDLSREMNNIFNVTFLVNFFTSSIAMCLMGFSMLMISLAHAFKYFVGLLTFIVFTFFICYQGSELTSASEKLRNAAFHSNWYEGNLPYRKMILFFIMRSEKPTVLSIHKFTAVSMPTFMAVLKLSYQLFSVFRATA
ncbi:putative odorant receptor 69a [Teleopsis dalmanni]|uniref:putative odorant receptor 69a n=1 Tax=Teleopsis dalmanni TaxID=139649 RepID=UPI0018CE7008|nr:putative odorant receptor 69a [Teleopsis dalmanni]